MKSKLGLKYKRRRETWYDFKSCDILQFVMAPIFFLLQERQLHVVREIVSSEKDIRDETREKLAMISSNGRYSRGNFESPGDRLNTINELNSTGSLLASFDVTTERTEEELELSVMRSSRPNRIKRTSEGYYPGSEKRRRASREVTTHFNTYLPMGH